MFTYTMLRLVLAVVLTLAAPTQTFTPGTGVISGVVIDDSSGSPIADAVAFLSFGARAAGVQPRQFTDAKGRFAFVGLPPSVSYTVSASKAGYLTGGYSSELTPGAFSGVIVLEDGEWVSSVRILLTRTGAINGTVMDEAGEPVVGVYVRLLARIAVQGRPELAAGPLATTDDRGAYRFSGLAPGRYLVSVPSMQSAVPASTSLGTGVGAGGSMPAPALDVSSTSRLVVRRYPLPPPPRGGVSLAYPITFLPNTPIVAEAGVIDLKAGDERLGADIRLEPTPVGHLAGRVEGPPEALVRLTLRLLAPGLEKLGHGAETATALVGADGRFEFVNVPAGAYTLDAPLTLTEFMVTPLARRFTASFPAPPGAGGSSMNMSYVPGAPPGTAIQQMDFRSNAPSFAARTSVVVRGGETTDLILQLRPLSRMTGRVVVDPDAPTIPDAAPAVIPSVRLEPANGDPSLGLPRSSRTPDGTPYMFVIEGLRAGPYCIRVESAGVWMIKSVAWRGRDYADEPFDAAATQDFDDVVVTVTRAVPSVIGAVRDERGQAVTAAAVIAFPVDPARRTNYGLTPTRLKMVRTLSTGRFRLALPPGEYYLVAVPANQAAAWQDAAFLEKIAAGAVRFSLDWGANVTRDVVIK